VISFLFKRDYYQIETGYYFHAFISLIYMYDVKILENVAFSTNNFHINNNILHFYDCFYGNFLFLLLSKTKNINKGISLDR